MSVEIEKLEEELEEVKHQIRDEYLRLLRESKCRVFFTKKDGTDREMYCTLNGDLIPEDKKPSSDGNSMAGPTNILKVYDLFVGGWRSIRIDTISEFGQVDD